MSLRVFSFGGGVQSTAALVLAAKGEIDFKTFLFANVGDDSENPATLEYVHGVSMPYAEKAGLDLIELEKVGRDGTAQTLYGHLTKEGSRSLPIPLRMSGTGAPGTRSCTANFKIAVTGSWMRQHGATKDDPATVGLGISVDEIQRAKPGVDPKAPYQTRTYPLLDLGLTRKDCYRIISEAGLPRPPKSSCYFCPFHAPIVWRDMARDEPELFEKACALEDLLNARRKMLGKDSVWLSRYLKPLRESIRPTEDDLFAEADHEMEECDEGVCFV